MTAAIPTFINSQRRLKKKDFAKKRWKAVRSKRSAMMGTERSTVALSIAGSDSSAGAGIQADLKTFSALGIYGLTAVTCVVAEIPGKVSQIEPVSARIVREQIEVLAKNFQIGAIKTGLLCSAEIISAVAKAIRSMHRNSASIEAYEKELFPLARLITPNLNEAERLLGTEIKGRRSMHHAGKELEREYGTAILLKGGHLAGDAAADLLFIDGKVVEFSAPFVRGVATHGTGCTYSAAITAGLASGLALEEAITQAKKFVTESIAQHFRWTSPSGKNLDALRHL
ncbi:MAG: bifunctional hydroxymethylpyrimidine kinase/phosphomethylpyrimidine kinase [Verrucomicrobia bacterium]|nr:MAG: bifunctional hydroxymethylpyrimidine kinase/phosphomethylpyrimidine kinase [Verrucomicrobiota bacterium]